MRIGRTLDGLRQDLLFALRKLRSSPGTSLLMVTILALGIGATTVLFAALHAVVLAPLPFPEPGEVVRLWEVREPRAGAGGDQRPGPRLGDLSAGDLVEVGRRAPVLEAVAGSHPDSFTLLRGTTPERLSGARVTPGFFRVLGIEPLHGRTFLAEEGEAGREAVAVVGHRVFRERFGNDPTAIGKTVRIDDRPHTLIGVLPPGTESVLRGQEIWAPLPLPEDPVVRWNEHTYESVARLADGISLGRARDELRALGRQIADEHPETAHGHALTVNPYAQDLVGTDARLLWVLFGATSLVLLIACADVSHLLMARNSLRTREMAIRTALGAGRDRLVRQLLTESALLATLGAAGGMIVASVMLRMLAALSPVDMPRLDQADLGGPVPAFALAATVASCLLFGLLPALRLLGSGSQRAALSGPPGGRTSTRSPRAGQLLVAAELALCLVLLAGAGLLIRTSLELQRVDPGFEPEGALSARLSLSEDGGDEAVARTFGRVVDELSGLPGVRAAAASSQVPLGGGSIFNGLIPEGSSSREDHVFAALRLSTPDLFEALGIPVLLGRTFTDRDDGSAPAVMIVNRTLAERAFPGEHAVGKRIGCCVSGDHPDFWREIVGVVGSTRAQGLDSEAPPEFYLPIEQAPPRSWDWLERTLVLVARAERPDRVAELAQPLRDAVLRVDPTLPVYDVHTLDERLSLSLERTRSSSVLLALLGAIALVLAGAGVYGVLAVFVGGSARELGVRSALGATGAELVRTVLGRALRPAVLGVAVGLLGAFGTGRLLAGFLYGVGPADPVTLLGVAGGLVGIALLAAWIPARRATRVDPVHVLRSE